MSDETICRACRQPIPKGTVHRVRIILTNAEKDAATAATDREDDFHFACAASIFSVFEGHDLHPKRPTKLSRAAAAPEGEQT